MQDTRRFIGWDRPVLPQAVERLREQYTAGDVWDLSQLLIVLPSGQARRRLIELLAATAQADGLLYYPPEVVTVGGLPEHLYTAKQQFASDLVQQLAWVHALQSSPSEDLLQLVPVPPPKQATTQWLELGKMLADLHRELASECLNFSAVVEVLGKAHPEAARWRALAHLQQAYLRELDRLELWDVQTARLCALEYRETRTELQIIMIGCVDLNPTQQGFLKSVAEHVEIWVAAPESERGRFDAYGCLHSEAWQSHCVNLPPDCLLVGNSPSDQGELVAACLADLPDTLHVRQVTLGVPDSRFVPELKHQLARCRVTARYGPGTPLGQAEPARLLVLIGRFLEKRSYSAFAALIRHPAVTALITRSNVGLPDQWLARIDSYYQTALPRTIGDFVNLKAPGATVYREVVSIVDNWIGSLSSRSRAISKWVQPLLGVLAAAYDKQWCQLDDPVEGKLYTAASELATAVLPLRDIPAELQPRMTLTELIDWLMRSIAGQLVPELPAADAIEMLGWLDLALDDAPQLVVAGMHDGVVPESVNSHAFLPNQLRRQLGMQDNLQRYARDLYLFQLMLNTRQRVRIVVGRTEASGDPLVPSRLLLACPLGELPSRVLHLVQESQTDTLPPVQRTWRPTEGASQLEVLPPGDVEPPRQMSVTAFRTYLKCPYRFYLQHVCKLRSQADEEAELDASSFGVLVHEALTRLGHDPVSRSTDPEEVSQFLVDQLHHLALEFYGPHPAAAVLIQVEQAELRLQSFAVHQAARAAEGWRIEMTERAVEFEDQVLVGKQRPLRLIGRIDRIDHHPQTGQWAIWDYKTSDTAKQPVAVHWSKSRGWQDLQLPLYLRLAERLGVQGTPTVGYINLPKQSFGSGFQLAEFTPAQLQEAQQRADEIADQVAAGKFWPPQVEAVDFDDFARICQTGVQRVDVPPPPRLLQRFAPEPGWQIAPKVVQEAERALAAEERTHPQFTPLLIRASAGTGKTFQLSNRLLQIILSGQEIDSILATTFTRKAAGEIMHRVLQRLALSCVDAAARQQLAEHVVDVDTSVASCLAALRRVTQNLHRLRISTLDSFFAQIARTFSLEMGLPPGWSPLDPSAEPQFQLQAIAQMIDGHDRQTLVDLVRMLAKGESSRQVTEEIRGTIAGGHDAFRNTDAAAWDQLPLPPAPSEAALESALARLAATRMNHKSIDKQLEKLHLEASAGNWEAVVGHGIYANAGEQPWTYHRKELPADLIVALQALSERAVAELLPVRRQQTLASYQILAAYDKYYNALVLRHRSLAFADVTYYLSRWMSGAGGQRSGPQPAGSTRAEQLEFRLDCGVRHLLLDEFQDTSVEQWRIVRPIAEPLGGPSTSEHSFFCVGDTKQAIYGWRGGVAEIFDSVQDSVKQLEQRELRDSFRSSPQVMSAVNQVFQNLDRHVNFAGCESAALRWSRSFPEHRTSRCSLPGYVRLQNGPTTDSQLSREEQKALLLEYSAQQIAELASRSGTSIGVLFRTNADVGRMIAILRDLGVSASQDGGSPLVDSVAVELLLSLIHLSDHPGDSLSAFHIAQSPLASQLPFNSSSQPQQLATWFRQQVARRGLAATLETLAGSLAEHLSWWDQHRLAQLIRSATAFQENPTDRLRDFEDAVMRDRVALPSESQVKVMTIHKSKGLEFDAVFLPDLSVDLTSSNQLLVLRTSDPVAPPTGVLRYMNANLQALLPASWQQAFADNKHRSLVEALCMLYVAMTRARSALYMTSRATSREPTQQYGSLLQSTLAAGSHELGDPEAILYEAGDPAWYGSQTGPSGQPSSSARSEEVASTIRLRTDAASAPVRGLPVVAPSTRSFRRERQPLSQAFSFSHSLQAVHGTLIHGFFQTVHWLDDYRLNRDDLQRWALATLSPDELQHISVDDAIDEFEAMLQLSSVQAALSHSRYDSSRSTTQHDRVEIHNERPVNLILDRQLVAGTIDRLAILMQDGQPVAAELFDFKTDAVDPQMSLWWLEDRVQAHRPQLALYAQIVSQLLGLPEHRIATFLVMLGSNDLVRVDHTAPASAAGSSLRTTPQPGA